MPASCTDFKAGEFIYPVRQNCTGPPSSTHGYSSIQVPTMPGSFQLQSPSFPIPHALLWVGPERHDRLL